MEWTELARLNLAVRNNLGGAEMISFVPNPRDNITKPDYWERSYIVTWSRPVRESQPSLDDDGFTYATHRVHINSAGEAACYNGNYDQKRNAALLDMLERARIEIPAAKPTTEDDPNLALWFTPQAIRQHFDGDDDEIAKWVEAADDGDLYSIGAACIGADGLYKEFHNLLKFEIKEHINA